MAHVHSGPRRAFIERDLRPDVPVAAEASGSEHSCPGSTADMVTAARQVLMDAGYQVPRSRWDPATFLARVMVQAADVQFTVLDDEAIILNLNNGHYYTLNPVGTVIWELIDGHRTLQAVLEGVCEQFDVDRERAHDDLVALVVRMEQEGLLHTERG